jgi:hypothetical protein
VASSSVASSLDRTLTAMQTPTRGGGGGGSGGGHGDHEVGTLRLGR